MKENELKVFPAPHILCVLSRSRREIAVRTLYYMHVDRPLFLRRSTGGHLFDDERVLGGRPKNTVYTHYNNI